MDRCKLLETICGKNNIQDTFEFIEDILLATEQIQDLLGEINHGKNRLELYFIPLQDSEHKRKLAFQKGKIRRNKLRLYAIKIDDDCYVITGGAIKMSQKMDEHADTANELHKLKTARVYLNANGVFDQDSFYELLSE